MTRSLWSMVADEWDPERDPALRRMREATERVPAPQPVQEALHHLKFKGHDIILFHILDHAETNFPFEGPYRFHEPETGEELEVDASAYREAYLRSVDSFIASYRDLCLATKVDYSQMDTSVPFDRALTTFLINRSQYRL